MKKMCAASYHHNSLLPTYVTGNTIYGYKCDVHNYTSCAQVREVPQNYHSHGKIRTRKSCNMDTFYAVSNNGESKLFS